jgi:hypothetical protein
MSPALHLLFPEAQRVGALLRDIVDRCTGDCTQQYHATKNG